MAKDSSTKTKSKPVPKPAKQVSNRSKLFLVPYLLFVAVIVAYSGFLYDEAGFRQHAEKFVVLKPLEIVFDAVEKYSPFLQVSLLQNFIFYRRRLYVVIVRYHFFYCKKHTLRKDKARDPGHNSKYKTSLKEVSRAKHYRLFAKSIRNDFFVTQTPWTHTVKFLRK
jgi:hypothetical protein